MAVAVTPAAVEGREPVISDHHHRHNNNNNNNDDDDDNNNNNNNNIKKTIKMSGLQVSTRK
jgi:hypothetical protein